MERSDTPDYDCCIANAPPRGYYEFSKIVGKSRRRTIRRCVIDAEGNDYEVGWFWRDARQELVPGIADGSSRKPRRAPFDRTTG